MQKGRGQGLVKVPATGLSASRRPMLRQEDDEVELLAQAEIVATAISSPSSPLSGVKARNLSLPEKAGRCYLTSHRVLLVTESDAVALEISDILQVVPHKSFMLKPAHLSIHYQLEEGSPLSNSSPQLLPKHTPAVAAAVEGSPLSKSLNSPSTTNISWICDICSEKNKDLASICDTCGMARTANAKLVSNELPDSSSSSSSNSRETPSGLAPQILETWICEICDLSNTGSISKCDQCGIDRILSGSITNNLGAKSPSSVSLNDPVAVSSTFTTKNVLVVACEICTFENTHNGDCCEVCGSLLSKKSSQPLPPSPSSTTAATTPIAADVTCIICTFNNSHGGDCCEVCGSSLPKQEKIQAIMTGTSSTSSLLKPTTSPTKSSSINNYTSSPSSPTKSIPPVNIWKLVFVKGGSTEFSKHLAGAIAAKAWEKKIVPETTTALSPSSSSPASSTGTPSLAMGGISSILKSVDQSQKRAEQSLNTAFTDLDALIQKAADMIKLAETISSRLAQATASGSTVANHDEDDVEMASFRNYLVNLGISNPVTKESAGDSYRDELARQLADFLDRVFSDDSRNSSGIMALVDVYCLFNRARGVALISPEDLQKSCAVFGKLKLPFSLRTFGSGLLCVQSLQYNDEAMLAKVHSLVKSGGKNRGLSASELASLQKISVPLAKEVFLLAESKALICRDDHISGLYFFDNLFK